MWYVMCVSNYYLCLDSSVFPVLLKRFHRTGSSLANNTVIEYCHALYVCTKKIILINVVVNMFSFQSSPQWIHASVCNCPFSTFLSNWDSQIIATENICLLPGTYSSHLRIYFTYILKMSTKNICLLPGTYASHLHIYFIYILKMSSTF